MPPFLTQLIDYFNNHAKFVLLVFQKYIQNFFYLQLETYTQNQTKFDTIEDLYSDIYEQLTKDQYLNKLVSNLLASDYKEVNDIKAIFAQFNITGPALIPFLTKSVIQSTNPKRVARTLGSLIYQPEQVSSDLVSQLEASYQNQQKLLNSDKVNNYYNFSTDLDLSNQLTNLPFVYANNRIYRTVQALDKATFEFLQLQNTEVEYFNTANTKPLLRLLYISLDSTHNMVERFTVAGFNFEHMEANIEFTALHQSQGIGRNSKAWNTAMISDVAVSYSIAQDQIETSLLNKLPLVFGQAIHQVVKQLLNSNAKNLLIKWPNDLYLDDKKLSGLLISKKDQYYIFSFGLNLLAKQPNVEAYINQPVSSLFDQSTSSTKTNIDLIEYNLNLSELVYNLLSAKSLTSAFNRQYYIENSWLQPSDPVTLIANDPEVEPKTFNAKYLGLNDQGFVELELEDGSNKTLLVPSYSIRKN